MILIDKDKTKLYGFSNGSVKCIGSNFFEKYQRVNVKSGVSRDCLIRYNSL